jgi:hypothetical protein
MAFISWAKISAMHITQSGLEIEAKKQYYFPIGLYLELCQIRPNAADKIIRQRLFKSTIGKGGEARHSRLCLVIECVFSLTHLKAQIRRNR